MISASEARKLSNSTEPFPQKPEGNPKCLSQADALKLLKYRDIKQLHEIELLILSNAEAGKTKVPIDPNRIRPKVRIVLDAAGYIGICKPAAYRTNIWDMLYPSIFDCDKHYICW